MNESELEQSILNFIALAEYRPMKPRAIAKHLKVPDEQIALVKRAIKRMVHHGQLQYGSNHLVMAADTAVKPGTEPGKTRPGRIAGVFQRTKKGFGFVRPHGATAEDREKTDIYIPADRAGDASTGDTVLVQLLKHRPGEPGLRGEVVEIIERETHQFVGTYFEARARVRAGRRHAVRATDLRGRSWAKNAQIDDKVVFEMVRFPSPVHDGEGVITEVLGPGGKPGVDTLSILREFDLPEAFPEDVLEEARIEAEKFNESIPAGRLNLSGETVITIDPEDARDFDDAISLRRLDGGNWLLGVHIADVTHFVRPKRLWTARPESGQPAFICPTACSPCCPRRFPTVWPAFSRAKCGTASRRSWNLPRTA